MKPNHKPVRKCHGCGLNLRDHCGVFEVPRQMWRRGKCSGYKNEELLAQYAAELERRQAKAAKEERRLKMKLRQTEGHWQGVRSMGASVH